MSRKISLILLFFNLLNSICLFSKDYDTLYQQIDNNNHQITFNINNWDIKDIKLNNNIYSKIIFSSSTLTEKKGWAELPFISASICISDNKNIDFKITYSEYIDVKLENPLLPSKGTIYRSDDASSISYKIDPNSIKDEFYPNILVKVDDPYIVRDVRGTSIRVFPFQYNSATNTLRIYTTIQVCVNEVYSNNIINPLLNKNNKIAKEALGIYQSLFLNFNKNRFDLVAEDYGNLLVICTNRDSETIEPYIKWKREKGFKVYKEVVEKGTNVKNLIKQKYNENNNIFYVQLVGDYEDIKSDKYINDCPTDPKLGCVVGDDNFPDISIGRFSCNNKSELEIQINKSINYEKNPNTSNSISSGNYKNNNINNNYLDNNNINNNNLDNNNINNNNLDNNNYSEDWYSTAIGIASTEGPGDDNEYDIVHIQNIYDNKLSSFTYNNYLKNYDPNANEITLEEHINQGASTLFYCGHGTSFSFNTTNFDIYNINKLNNGDRLPFIVACACHVGAFHIENDCFAEKWLKKENGGAILTLMSTISQPWRPPMRGQDYFYDILIGGYNYDNYSGQNGINTNEQRTTWGAITLNSFNLMLTESQLSNDINTVHTWTTFGDVSLQLRTAKPEELFITNDIVFEGADFNTTVFVDDKPVKNALVCISQDNNYYSGITDENGKVTINHNIKKGDYLLVVTAFNTTTLYKESTCISTEGAYIIVDGHSFDGDNKLAAGETSTLSLSMRNIGIGNTTSPTTVTLSCDNDDITIVKNSANFGKFNSNESLTVDGVYTIKAKTGIENNKSYLINVTSTNENNIWESSFLIKVYSPSVTYKGCDWQEYYNPGDTILLSTQFKNNGGITAKNAITTLYTSNSNVTISENTYAIGDIEQDGVASALFNIIIPEDIEPTTIIPFDIKVSGDNFNDENETFEISNRCNIIFHLKDSYGDGWNFNAKLEVSFDNGDPNVYIQLKNGKEGFDTINVNTGVNITLKWIANYDDAENSFSLFYESNPNNIIYEVENPNAGVLYSFTADCTTNLINIDNVTNLNYNLLENNNVKLTWNHLYSNSIDSYIIKRNGLEIGTTNQLSFIDENTELGKTYNYCVIAVKNNIYSIPSCLSIDIGNINICDPISNLNVVNNNNYTLTASWTGNNLVEYYKVYINDVLAATITNTSCTTEALQEGYYTVCVSSVYPNCESEQICYDNIQIIGISNYNVNLNDKVSIYPNPADKVIYIDGTEASNIKIFNNLGQLVLTTDSANKVDICSLKPGIYIANITNYRGEKFSCKIVVK